MKYKEFRNHEIKRTCKTKYKAYQRYKKFLAKDFNHRCAYCNMKDIYITEEYCIDHFIPVSISMGTSRESLKTDYNNLMYSCPKCNLAKSNQYDGNLMDGSYDNKLFYNPVEVDYNIIFFRNEYGGIDSMDEKGRQMITKLKLYRGIHNLAFLIEEIDNTLTKLNNKMDNCKDEEELKYYQEADIKLSNYYRDLTRIFNSNYSNNSVKGL